MVPAITLPLIGVPAGIPLTANDDIFSQNTLDAAGFDDTTLRRALTRSSCSTGTTEAPSTKRMRTLDSLYSADSAPDTDAVDTNLGE